QLSPSKRARVVSLRKRGVSFPDIGKELKCDPSTACRTYHRRRRKENFYAITPGRGRPKRLDAHDQRVACRMIRSGEAQTAADVQHDRF
ncbi:hypothetical protein DFH09DRAFT_837808, partial [Mycena vulgaris]